MRDAHEHNGVRILAHARASIGCVCVCVMHWYNAAVCPFALGRLARVSHQQLMAGATQLVVTGAFARASLSAAAYQLRLTRKPRSENMCMSRKERREKVISLRYAPLRRYAILNFPDSPLDDNKRSLLLITEIKQCLPLQSKFIFVDTFV